MIATGAMALGDDPDALAIKREYMEYRLYDWFHWTPEIVAKIPYKKIQQIFMFKRIDNDIQQAELAKAAAKNKSHVKTR